MTNQPTLDSFCALESINAAEALYGTASAETSVWFLLEYTDPWAARATENNNLPAEVQEWFSNHLATIPQSELLFIKQDKAQTLLPTFRFFIAVTREKDQRLYAFTIENYEELLGMDVPAIVDGDHQYDQYINDQPQYFICTNGKRDRCCAKFGFELYQAMRSINDVVVWQVTHIGGHRYSPTFAVFPQGIFYGQVTPLEAADVMHAIAQKHMVLDKYRGRNCYTGVQQAADYYARTGSGIVDLNALVIEETSQATDGSWRVVFYEQSNGRRHEVKLTMTLSEPVLAGCTMMKYKPRPLYELRNYELI